jgi:hypothetical protein
MRQRARRTIEGLLKGVFYEVTRPKNFTVSELGDRPDHLLVKSSLPLT